MSALALGGGLISVGSQTYNELPQAIAAASTSHQPIRLGAGEFAAGEQIVLPDDGTCANIEGSGISATVIKLTNAISGSFVFKGPKTDSFGCRISNLTIDAQGQAPRAVELQVGRAWTIENVRAQNGTVENWQFGDYLGQGRQVNNIRSAARTNGEWIIQLEQAPMQSIAGQFVQLSSSSRSSLAGYCTSPQLNGDVLRCRQAGRDTGAQQGGTITFATGTGFYEFSMLSLYSDYSTSLFTGGTQPAYGFHWYPAATDSAMVSGLISRNARVASFENCGGQISIIQSHGYGYPNPAYIQDYSYEDCGVNNRVALFESDGPRLAAIHIGGTSVGLLFLNSGALFLPPYQAIPLAIIETGAYRFNLGNIVCADRDLASGPIQPAGAGMYDPDSSIGLLPACQRKQ
jgi:hypothetical protein